MDDHGCKPVQGCKPWGQGGVGGVQRLLSGKPISRSKMFQNEIC